MLHKLFTALILFQLVFTYAFPFSALVIRPTRIVNLWVTSINCLNIKKQKLLLHIQYLYDIFHIQLYFRHLWLHAMNLNIYPFRKLVGLQSSSFQLKSD